MEQLRDLGIAITGGAGDIGSAMGRELAKQGASVTLVDTKSSDTAEPWLAEVREFSNEVAYITVDVRDRNAVDEAMASIDPLDIAIGNAGIVDSAPFLDITEEQWHHHLNANLTGCFNLGQSAARLMVERGTRGRILFTSSWVQDVPWPEIAAYSVSKAGIRTLARQMARELAKHGILVNVIAPGIVNAGLARWQMENEPQYASRVQDVIPLGEPQTPEQVAKATAFLCSDASDYMTGSSLLIDGGCSLFQFDE